MKRRKFNLLVTVCALTGASGIHAEGFDIEGKYDRIVPNQPTETPEGVIEVVDVFGYRCPHCFSFLPVLDEFERQIPADVQVRHMPVIFRKDWEVPARAFYTAELLGVTEKMHRPIFEALHVDKRSMDGVGSWRQLFVDHGVSAEDFDKTFKSFAVESGMRKSRVMQGRYGVSGTPSLIVNGKYRISPGAAGGFENMIKIAEGLIALERKAAGQSG